MSKTLNIKNVDAFFDLRMVRFVGIDKWGSKLYEWQCKCGNRVIVSASRVLSGKTKSCGCRKGLGLSKDITYKSWIGAKQRCTNPNNHNYHNYGGRGIKMCKRWMDSYVAFIEDMGLRPSKEYTLDRIDVNGDYEKDNCRWASHKEQSNNRRDNRIISYKGIDYTCSEFSRKFGVNYSNLKYEIRNGLSPNDIVEKYTNKVQKTFKHNKCMGVKIGITLPIDFVEVEELNETDRNDGAYGSTGK